MVTYEYVPDENTFKTLHFETYGKSGIRRVVPGEYLAADPKGRAVMAASTEKNKLVYVLTRHGQTDIAISSPLEANKPQTLVFFLLGLDVGYDNPMFATLEVDYSASEADPTDEAAETIRQTAASLRENLAEGTEITVIGHTDSTGSDGHNQTLSEQRAEADAA